MVTREPGDAPFLLSLYYLIAGLYLMLLPWTKAWESLPAACSLPEFIGSFPVRGFVSGLGMLHLLQVLRKRP